MWLDVSAIPVCHENLESCRSSVNTGAPKEVDPYIRKECRQQQQLDKCIHQQEAKGRQAGSMVPSPDIFTSKPGDSLAVIPSGLCLS